MSFLFGGQRQPSSAEKIAMAENEMELIQDMYAKLNAACTRKCLPKDYREGELNKGESVCLDRCVAKYMEVNMKIGEKMQTDANQKAGAAGMGGGGVFGR